MGGITINECERSYEWSREKYLKWSREWSSEWSRQKYLKWSGEWSGEWSCETLLHFIQCRSWSFTIFEYNINISTLVYVSFNGICYNNRVGWNGVRPIAIYDDSFVWLFILRR
jgi:hypothetical protein